MGLINADEHVNVVGDGARFAVLDGLGDGVPNGERSNIATLFLPPHPARRRCWRMTDFRKLPTKR